MPETPHSPAWHLLEATFPPDPGPVLPAPVRTAGAASLRIAAPASGTLFFLTPAPSLPAIPVHLELAGVDPAATPVEWRLSCRHRLARFRNSGGYRYRPVVRLLEREWRGQVRSADFALFAPECPCSYNQPGRVMGGDAILQVAVTVPGATLTDAVSLRIAGSNPTPELVLAWLAERFAHSHPNLLHMVRAIFAHESGYRQFSPSAQSGVWMNFTKRQHADAAQPDCRVRFDWPADPPNFPLSSYDFGVGISQWTNPDALTPDLAWDWRENIRLGANLFLDRLHANYRAGQTWKDWAMVAWAAYNGSGPAAQAYAQALAASADGRQVTAAAVPPTPTLARLEPPAALPDPGGWLVG